MFTFVSIPDSEFMISTASLGEIKKELKHLPSERLLEICLQLGKYKKENKGLLSYLLFDASDKEAFVLKVKDEMDAQFSLIHPQVHLAKKTIRKVLRTATQYVKYSGSKQIEADLLLHFCFLMQSSGIRISAYPVLAHLYERQLIKIEKAISLLHEDLQYDYNKELAKLN